MLAQSHTAYRLKRAKINTEGPKFKIVCCPPSVSIHIKQKDGKQSVSELESRDSAKAVFSYALEEYFSAILTSSLLFLKREAAFKRKNKYNERDRSLVGSEQSLMAK